LSSRLLRFGFVLILGWTSLLTACGGAEAPPATSPSPPPATHTAAPPPAPSPSPHAAPSPTANGSAWHQTHFLLSAYNPPFAWHGPPYEDAVFARYQAAHFHHLLWVRDDGALIARARQFGFSYYLDIADLIGEEKLRGEEGPPDEITAEDLRRLDQFVEKYKNDPLMAGYYLCDEPYPAAFPNIARVLARIRTHDTARPAFVNLFPYFSEEEGSPAYIEAFLQTVHPDMLVFDRYIFFNDRDETSQYLAQLRLIRKYALQSHIPFVSIIQGVGTNGTQAASLNWRTPSEAEMRWLVYTSLTFGVHGIVWFHWDHEWGVTGNPDGPKVYPAIQHLNQKIQTLGPVMVSLTSTDVFGTAAQLVVLPGDLGRQKLLSSGSELLAGVFRSASGREDHFMLTNLNYREALEPTITMHLPLRSLETLDVTTGKWEKVPFENHAGGATFSILLPPGGGRLFRFALEK